MASIFGRSIIVPLTNKSGGSVALGDVVVVDTTADESFTTTTSAASTSAIGVAAETIANNAVGRIVVGGYVSLVNVNASVTRNQFGTTHTVAKQAVASATRVAGTFCRWLKSSAAPSAYIYPVDLAGTALTNPMTTAGDSIIGGASGTPARLAVGANGTRPYSDGTTPSWAGFIGCKAYHSTTESFATSANRAMLLDFEAFDTHTFHFTSAANLTGTVAKAAASPNIVGTSTLFTSELTVNQVISIPGTATEIGVVKTITDNTHLELWQTMANTASGQTATRKNQYLAIPAGFPTNGKWRVSGGTYWDGYSGSGVSYIIIDHGASGDNSGWNNTFIGCIGYHQTGSSVVLASPGDYFSVRALNGSSATQLLGTSATSDAYTNLTLEFVGA